MKIAVTAFEPGLEGKVNEVFGRANCFVVVDSSTGSNKTIDNEQVMNIPQGAGIQAAKTIVDSGAEALITGHVGPKAHRALSSAGVKIYLASGGTVGEAVNLMIKGKLKEATSPDVDGHWV